MLVIYYGNVFNEFCYFFSEERKLNIKIFYLVFFLGSCYFCIYFVFSLKIILNNFGIKLGWIFVVFWGGVWVF